VIFIPKFSLIPMLHLTHNGTCSKLNSCEDSPGTKLALFDDGEAVLMTPTERGAWHVLTTRSFDVLVTDLPMPDPKDGFTVISAMRHAQPNALTRLVSFYPDVQSAMVAILPEADESRCEPHSRSAALPRYP